MSIKMRVPVLFFAFILLVMPVVCGGEETGWYEVRMVDSSCGCPLDGGAVYFDGDYMGEITRGKLIVSVVISAAEYHSFQVEKQGFLPYNGTITSIPAANETVRLTASMVPAADPGEEAWETGYYRIRCNADGAAVFFGEVYVGSTVNGELIAAPPPEMDESFEIRVEKDGYARYEGVISVIPPHGTVMVVGVTLDPEPTPSPAKSPFPILVIFAALLFTGSRVRR
jgi:hypothetical protein